MHLRLPWFPAGHDRMLAIALGASIVLHAVLLSVHFKFPDALRSSPAEGAMRLTQEAVRTARAQQTRLGRMAAVVYHTSAIDKRGLGR